MTDKNRIESDLYKDCTVLIVDDMPGNIEVIENHLKTCGLTTLIARSGEIALKRISYKHPDIILLDVMMPGIDGFETCQRLKSDEKTKDIPVIFMTALTDLEHKVKGFSAGGVDYITKPIQKEELLARVTTHLKIHKYQETLEQNVQERTAELEKRMKALVHEIAVRKRAEGELKKARNYISNIINSMPSVLIGVDTKGKITLWNKAAEQTTGLSSVDVLDRKLPDVIPWMAPEMAKIKQSIQTGKAVLEQKRPRIKWGSTCYEDVTTYPLIINGVEGVVIRVDDVTEKIQLEEVMELNKRQYNESFQSIAESTAQYTGQDLFDAIVKNLGRLFGCDYAFLGKLKNSTEIQTLSVEHDDRIGKNFSYPLKGTPSEKIIKNGNCLYKENVMGFFPEDRILVDMKAQGHIGIQLRGENEQVLGVLCAISRRRLELPDRAEDILNILQARASAEIERIGIFEEKTRLEVQLQQAQKMEAIGTLAGGIAHDFNNILSVILGYSDMLRGDLSLDTATGEKIDQIIQAGHRAKDLVGQILAFSRQSKRELKPMQPALVIKEVLKMLRASIPTSIKISQDISDCGSIIGDPTQLHQIVMNLCTNAYHAMRETGGMLEVSLKPVILDEKDIKTQSLALSSGPHVKLQISDTGHGIDKAIQQKIFDPYFTTKKKGDGSGLGLAVVHGFVKSFGGHISVYSEPGKGTSFCIYLPQIISETKPAMAEYREPIPTGSGHILIVDDESSIVEMETIMLESLGYQVSSCISSPEALRIFQNQPEAFSLVITDMTMPDMTGVELIQKIRALKQNIPVIICSGYSELINKTNAKRMGIDKYLMKPILKRDLAMAVKEILNK